MTEPQRENIAFALLRDDYSLSAQISLQICHQLKLLVYRQTTHDGLQNAPNGDVVFPD